MGEEIASGCVSARPPGEWATTYPSETERGRILGVVNWSGGLSSRYSSDAERLALGGREGQPRPAFGLVPWLAFDLRAFIFFFDVRFDIGTQCYRAPVQASTSSADHVLTIDSSGTPHRAALSAP